MKPPAEFIEQFLGPGRGITDESVVRAMMTVERDRFVPPELRADSYHDKPLPIGENQTISQPFIVAYMVEKLALEAGDRVLEVGAGSGYEAAVLAELGAEVFTIERIPSLADMARENLLAAGYDRVHIRTGDGSKGWPEHAPFDAIVVACAAFQKVPTALIAQLADGGRLVLPVEESGGQQLLLLERRGEVMHRHPLIAVRFVPLVEDPNP